VQNNSELTNYLIDAGVLHTPNLIQAFKKIDRKDFLPAEVSENAYVDEPLPIGYGQTNSQPYTVVLMLELLNPKIGDSVLDIGAGSGWTTALLAEAVGQSGKVLGLELVAELVDLGRANLKKLQLKNAKIRKSLPGTLGKPNTYFDRILVSAAAESLPEVLVKQLKVGGILVVRVQNTLVKLRRVSRNRMETEKYAGFVFVALK
jgi:protein-L-isoaspartate(D-aspartate) O-methyltransferase